MVNAWIEEAGNYTFTSSYSQEPAKPLSYYTFDDLADGVILKGILDSYKREVYDELDDAVFSQSFFSKVPVNVSDKKREGLKVFFKGSKKLTPFMIENLEKQIERLGFIEALLQWRFE